MNPSESQGEKNTLAKTRNLKRNTLPALTMAGPVTFWMLVFVLLPLLYVVFISFMRRDAFGGIDYHVTLSNYVEILQPVYLKVIWKSIKLALLTTVICILIGYPLAYYIARKPSKLAAKLLMLVMIPFWTNTLVRLYSINLMGQPNGFLNQFLLRAGLISKPLDILYSDGIVVVGLLISMLPFAILPLYASIEKLDKSYLEASSDLGARPAITFLRVTIPLTLPGIVAAVMLVFIPSLGMYYVPEALGGGKVMLIGSLIRNQFLVTKNWPFGASLSILLLLITLIMLWLYTRIAKLDDMEVF
ncbi:MAG: Spermidine Putrescine transporter permease component PotB [Bacillota bacterium]|jgi:spermidine/putrescine transport system permease protein|nr:Spermidine Putrescine transporter permease component PotB [Bacillota bacterium]